MTLAEIHSALAYYYDHQEELDADIERRRREADQITANATDPGFRKKLLERRNRR
ncbi:MAG TPA: hypothetical protein VEZ90_18370 [Blastocatellia bacterium]|nr:hypothetical protein [Blastocatellia bacterium]